MLYGEQSQRVFLFVHGQGGNKEEAERFARLAVPMGWQVLSVDLPEHSERTDGAKLLPWIVLPELQYVMQWMRKNRNRLQSVAQLQQEREIATSFGQTLSWEHWLHTPEQLHAMEAWESVNLQSHDGHTENLLDIPDGSQDN